MGDSAPHLWATHLDSPWTVSHEEASPEERCLDAHSANRMYQNNGDPGSYNIHCPDQRREENMQRT